MDDQGVNYSEGYAKGWSDAVYSEGYAKGWSDAVAHMRDRLRRLNSPREDLCYFVGWDACRRFLPPPAAPR